MEYPDQEPYWTEESWSGEEGVWNLIGAVSKVKTRCTVSGDPCPVRNAGKVPSRRMHPGGLTTKISNKFGVLSDRMSGAEEDTPFKVSIEEFIKEKVVKKKTAVKQQPMTKKMSKMHTIVEVADEAEMDRIIKMQQPPPQQQQGCQQRERMNNMIPWGEQCGCCRSPSAMIVPELHQEKKDERVEKLAKWIQKNSETAEAKLIAGLTVKPDALAPCAEKISEWTKLSLAGDSGACESVIDAAEQVPGYDVQESRASKSGLVYASATGEEIPNLGEVLLPMLTKENTKRSMKMQAAEVSRPLASVKRICEAGHVVVFDEDGSFIFSKMTGDMNQPREESGNYMFDVWVPPKNAATTFRRQ